MPPGSSRSERKGVVYALERPGAAPKRLSREGVKVFPLLSFAVVA
jgi:hypothetical protein